MYGTTLSLRQALCGAGLVSVALGSLAGCGPGDLSSGAERGRQVYLSQCTQCHALDPSQPGPVGPPVKGASRDLLEAKVVRGGYPRGYTPKRTTSIMPPQPRLAADIPALAEFLK